MSLLIVGSMALDTIETPYGKREYILGGSCTYITTSASYLTDGIRMVGIVGYDFPKQEIEFFKSKGIDTSGVEISSDKKTFHWHGVYHKNMNIRDSITTDLNAFETFDPVIPEHFRDSDFVCLGNVDPVIQKKVITQLRKPKLTMIDTMDFWIEGKLPHLLETLKLTDIIMINDSEARLLSGEDNLVIAGRKILTMGPKIIIIKKGEHGALLITPDTLFSVPALPLEKVIDPTGAGDTFAGGFMGWINRTNDFSNENLKMAIVCGTVMASLIVQDFSLEGIRDIPKDVLLSRFRDINNLTYYKDIVL